jgi:transcription antitermination protein NusB
VAARSKARKRALDVLFEAEQRDLPVLELLAERMTLGDRPTPEYAAQIVRGVAAHRAEIDKLIAGNSVGWTLERMPAVDRNVLRIGVWELRWAEDVPSGVAISEAVELAQDLSTDGSPAFVNGLLAKVAAIKDDEPAVEGLEPGSGAEQPDDGEPPDDAKSADGAEPAVGAEPLPGGGASGIPESADGDEAVARAPRPRTRPAGLVRPKISSVLRPAPDAPEGEPNPED